MVARPPPRAEVAYPLAVLGHVHQLEERRERARHTSAVLTVDGRDAPFHRSGAGRRGTFVESDHLAPQPLDRPEQLLAVVSADRVAQQRGEQADVAAERVGRGPPPAAGVPPAARDPP